MPKAKSPRMRKTETSGKLEKVKKSPKKRSNKTRGRITSPLRKVFGFLGKGLKWIVPGFLKGALYEVRQVTWPGRKETLQLTWAVFVFAIVFSIIVASLDLVLDRVFRSIILG